MQGSSHVSPLSLRHVLPQGQFTRQGDIRVRSCATDPRRCQDGDLFIAVQRPKFDGHDHVELAIQRGAAAVLAERMLPVDVPMCLVPDSREALGIVAQKLAGQPSEQLRTIGVAGSNGKTVVSALIASIMRTAKVRTGVLNTIERNDGYESTAARNTTPNASVLAEWMATMAGNGCGSAVVEVTSRALAERRVAGMSFDAAVLTNLRRKNVQYHGTVQNYRRSTLSLFRRLKPDGFVVLNADDPTSQYVRNRTDHPVVTFGMRAEADVTAQVVERYAGEQTFLLTAGNETAAVQTRMFGDHHVYNCLAAASVGLAAGLDLLTVARGLEGVSQIPGRMEPVICGQSFGVYVDYARTPDQLAVVLKSLRAVTSGRVICVFGVDAAGDAAQRPLMGRVVERHANLGIITNDNPRHASPLELAHDVLDGYDRPSRAHLLPSRPEAIRWALGQARAGDTVLIAGRGDQTFQIVRGKRKFCDDRQVAREWLSGEEHAAVHEETRDYILPFPTSAQSPN